MDGRALSASCRTTCLRAAGNKPCSFRSLPFSNPGGPGTTTTTSSSPPQAPIRFCLQHSPLSRRQPQPQQRPMHTMTAAVTASAAGSTAAAAAGVAPGASAVAGAGMAARLRAAISAADGLPPPPYPALVGSEAGSFAEATITARLPAILESMIRDLEADVAEGEGAGAGQQGDAAVAAGQVAAGLAELRSLRRSMLGNEELRALQVAGAAEQTQVLLDCANAGVELVASRQQTSGTPATWLGLPWLTVECFMYAAIHAALQRQPPLAGRDPFRRQKWSGWVKSAAAAAEMAEEVELLLAALAQPTQAAGAEGAAADAAAKAAGLAGMQMALWGNKADLSLLVNAKGLDGLSLSVTSSMAKSSSESLDAPSNDAPPSRVIVDDSEAVWGVMAALRARSAAGGSSGGAGAGADDGVRVDIILDNSGLELFADLCLAELLMAAGVADTLVLHGKPISWFVSDTLAADLEWLLDSCEAAEPASNQVSAAAWQPVRRLAARWRAHLAAGRWRWAAHPFWCTPAPFCWMAAVAPDLHAELAGSGLLVFKGDLNYRKLTQDCRWPHMTPFRTSLQGFAPAPLVALRTLKADVVAGLAPGQSEVLTAADADWLVNGKWGMVQAAL